MEIKYGGKEKCSANQAEIWKNVLEIKDGGRFQRVIWKSKMAEIWEQVLEIKDSGHLGECSGNQRWRTFERMLWKSNMEDIWKNGFEIKDGGCSSEFSEILPSVKDPHPY